MKDFALDECQHLPTLHVVTQRPRRPVEADTLQVTQQPVNELRARMSRIADRIPDSDYTRSFRSST